MSGDILERLRVDCECYDGDTCVHAAARDEIERLRAAGDALADQVPVFDPDAEPTCLTVWREARREQ